ncbi:MAG: BamA/TamA family outer membrane protein [Persicimonas sp.]
MGFAVIVALCLLLCPGYGSAESAKQDCTEQEDGCEPVLVEAITIGGLQRTKPHVVHRELQVSRGELASRARIAESIQRVRNTGLFREVTFELAEVTSEDDRAVTLHIEVDERWTALPMFQLSSGGGTYRLVTGAYDTNFLGRYLGIGGRYERLGETNSFYVWAYDPRAFDERLRLGVDLGSRNRTFALYGDDGLKSGGFLVEQFTVGASVEKEWRWWLRTAASVRFEHDDFSLSGISPDIADLQRERGLPEPAHFLSASLGASFGRIDQHNYNFEGTTVGVSLRHANAAIGSTHDEVKFGLSLKHFTRLPLNSNLGVRVAAKTSSAEAVHRRYYVGGLDSIRGFPHQRFAGEHYWQASAEYRIPSFDMRWFVLQHIAFVDAAGVSEDIGGFATVSGASAGVGVRVMVPKIQGLIARFDYAWPLDGHAPNALSVGGGQFF